MDAKFPVVAALAALLIAAPAMAFAQGRGAGTRDGTNVVGVDQSHTVDCGGRPAEVTGTGNRIAYVGDCPALTISGTDNQVSITLRPNAPLHVSGVSNVVTWRVNGKGRPRITVSGVDNRVAAAR